MSGVSIPEFYRLSRAIHSSFWTFIGQGAFFGLTMATVVVINSKYINISFKNIWSVNTENYLLYN